MPSVRPTRLPRHLSATRDDTGEWECYPPCAKSNLKRTRRFKAIAFRRSMTLLCQEP